MRFFTLICSLLLIALGAAGHYGWGVEGEGPRTLVSAIPGGFGLLMLIGVILALLLRRTGLQLAFLAAVAGGFSGLGRLTPSYLKETLGWQSQSVILVAAMSAVCLVYVLVAGFRYLFVRKKPVPGKETAEGAPPPEASGEAEGESEAGNSIDA
jgi:hypothetical protein